MDVLRFVVGCILPYVAIIVFLAGMTYRLRLWLKLGSPSITLTPAPATEGGNVINALEEAVLFKSLFKSDRLFWALAWGFHAVLALIFVGHIRVVSNVDVILMKLGMSEKAIDGMSSVAGGAAGIVILAAVVLLLARRFWTPRVAEISGLGDYLVLLLIAAIVITGDMMRFGSEHFDLTLTREYFAALVTFSGATQATVLHNNIFVVHMGLGFLLIMVMPFSKLLHFGGVFFTHELIRKN